MYGNPPRKISFSHVGLEWKNAFLYFMPVRIACYIYCLKKNTTHFPAGAPYRIWPGRQRFASLFSNLDEAASRVAGRVKVQQENRWGLGTPLSGDTACASFSVSVPGSGELHVSQFAVSLYNIFIYSFVALQHVRTGNGLASSPPLKGTKR